VGGWDEGGAPAGIVLLQESDDGGSEVDARLVGEAVGGGVFLQDDDVRSVALQGEALE